MTENVQENEQSIRETTERENPNERLLWLEGIDLLYASFLPLHQVPFKDPAPDHVMVTTLMHAATTQSSAYLLAVSGYCVQALPLARLGYQDWIMHWYAKNKPQDADLLLSKADQTETISIAGKNPGDSPKLKERRLFVQDLLPEMEKLVATPTNQPGYKDTTVRGWRDHVNRLAHAGFASLRRSYTVDGRVTSVQLGPQYDKMRFFECVSEFCSEIPPLLNAVEIYCRFRTIAPADPGQWEKYQKRVVDWQQNVYAPNFPDSGRT